MGRIQTCPLETRKVRTIVGLALAGWLAAAIGAPVRISADTGVLDAVNAQRRANGLGAVSLDSRLVRAAAAHARDLNRRGVLDHRGSNGSKVGDRVTRAGYRWSEVAENLALTATGSARAVVALWMKSPGHRRNLLNRRVTQIGASRVGDTWVLVLARPAR